MKKNPQVEKLLAKSTYSFDDLCTILEILRGEGGCPWDAEQTHESIRKNFIEETYEVIEAIDTKDYELLREELGDVLLQVVFHTQMEKEAGRFDINDVANEVCAKLIHRHPHIFADTEAKTAEEVLSNWEAIKNVEKSRESLYDKLVSVPAMSPALMRAQKVAKKSGEFKALSSFEIISHTTDLLKSIESESEEEKSKIMGEVLFWLSALNSKENLDAEECLYKYTNAFVEKYKD